MCVCVCVCVCVVQGGDYSEKEKRRLQPVFVSFTRTHLDDGLFLFNGPLPRHPPFDVVDVVGRGAKKKNLSRDEREANRCPDRE